MAKATLGQTVTYVGANGKKKVGLVIGTADTIEEGTSVPSLEEDQVHLLVFSPTGNAYMRTNVAPQSDEKVTEVYLAS